MLFGVTESTAGICEVDVTGVFDAVSGLMFFSFCRRLQNQMCTVFFFIRKEFASLAMVWDDGFLSISKCFSSVLLADPLIKDRFLLLRF